MVYLVGGYIATYQNVEEFCQRQGLDHPNLASMTRIPNRWLIANKIRARLLAVDYDDTPMIMVITDKQVDPLATPANYTPFVESERAIHIKTRMNIEVQGFVTVANPFG
jgi:hypothetical protein